MPEAAPNDASLATLATGQAFEFRVWAQLIQQSRGQLHVFLPLLDVGLDAVIHRLGDGAYIPVQLKGRSRPVEGRIEVRVPDSGLMDDSALMIIGWLEPSRLGPYLLVLSEADFKRLAAFDSVRRDWVAHVAVRPPAHSWSRWAPYMVPLDALAARLLGPAAAMALPFLEALPPRERPWLGFLGEQEVVRQLAAEALLDLFRPFPDLETVEVLVRDAETARYAGLQVKTGSWDASNPQLHVTITARRFRPAPRTYLVLVAWRPELARFDERCLLIPSEKLPEVAVRDSEYWVIEYRPESGRRTRLDPYRLDLASLAEAVRRVAQHPAGESPGEL